jgi:ABC-type bacteriocin/lantibiotic exporter with double-glycine peptidase domain
MRRYFPQETVNACGVSALRNVLKQFGIIETENKLRKLCKANDTGVNGKDIVNAIIKLNLNAAIHYTRSIRKFRQIFKGLKTGKKYIILVDSIQHWICAIGYYNKYIKIVDTDFMIEKRRLAPELTERQIIEMAHCYDKFKDKRYFYFIEIWQQEA